MSSLSFSLCTALAMTAGHSAVHPGTWVQSSLGYVEHNISNRVGASIANNSATSQPVPTPPQTGVDDSTHPHAYPQKLTGDDPDNGPTWDPRFTTLNDPTPYVNQPWSFPATGSIPAHYGLSVFSNWLNKNGWQAFDYQVGGANTGTSARRDLDWWDQKGVTAVYSPIPGGGGGPE